MNDAFDIDGHHPADILMDDLSLGVGSVYLGRSPVPSRRQVAAVLRTLADFTHNQHMLSPSVLQLGERAGVATADAEHGRAVGLSRYLNTLAHHVGGGALGRDDFTEGISGIAAAAERESHLAFELAGDHPGDRIMRSLERDHRGQLDLNGEPVPTPGQVACVLSALSDFRSAFRQTRHMLSDAVVELGADRDNFGRMWQHATGLGRYFHRLADHLAYGAYLEENLPE